MFSKGKKISTYIPSVEKLEGSITYWENYYRIKLNLNSRKLFLKNAKVSIQNKKQISAFVHGYIRGLLVDPDKYVIRTKPGKTNFEMFESIDVNTSLDMISDHTVQVLTQSVESKLLSLNRTLMGSKKLQDKFSSTNSN
jgi:hypothetical protein